VLECFHYEQILPTSEQCAFPAPVYAQVRVQTTALCGNQLDSLTRLLQSTQSVNKLPEQHLDLGEREYLEQNKVGVFLGHSSTGET